MNMNKIPKKSKQIEFKYLEGETFILHLDKGLFYKLDKVGTDIWKLIDGKRDTNEIIKIIYTNYEVKRSALKKDVTDFIEKCIKIGIISVEH